MDVTTRVTGTAVLFLLCEIDTENGSTEPFCSRANVV